MKFAKEKIKYPDGSFELFLPKNWNWKVENYENKSEIILGIDAISKPDKENYINIISIQKTKGFSIDKSLESEYNMALNNFQKNKSLKLIESGKTKLLENLSYYIHSKSNTGNYGEVEIITLITKSNDNNFYHLTVSASTTKELKLNMAVMIQCLKTFKQYK
ncbi:hypothetical protein C3L50_00885 [Flavobacterium alvei]|uniref:PsbP C-terminal domain-containing protein n=1 Tax=Flavobacterium alvei TaxID=2080416 RepID=A0A2S5AF13_9FLAO|nr:hypothetical protein C3L50_00885 [Flavobacterium alvei]